MSEIDINIACYKLNVDQRVWTMKYGMLLMATNLMDLIYELVQKFLN